MRTIKIDLWTDVVCPWCLIGSARLDKAIAALPDNVRVDVENHPFYLDPNTPPEGYDVGEMLRGKYGRDPREIWSRAEEQAKLAGIDLDLSQQPRTFPTQKAHTVVRLARPKGTQHALANAIAEAYFLEHRQVNDDSVLAEIAGEHGFTREEALRDMADPRELEQSHQLAIWAAQQGIQGVPFFIFDGKFALSGAQPDEVFTAAFAKVMEEPA
ncbi:MAG TPA: DsbA family oxidoreductase [Devosia sp.]|jgi:predicted DsbA family dithiol-disulfide isomerase|nr:DsbA family oxidoreductase [Devosia sp.]